MKKPSQTTILFLLIGIMTTLVLIAQTDLMDPVMKFILATDQGTPLQLIGCVIAAAVGFRIAYVLLNIVGEYYSGELDAIQQKKMSAQGGEQP
jgi:hypothetical protein